MLQEFNSGRRETTQATEASSLRSQAGHDSGAAIKKTRSVGDASGEVIGGVRNWTRPPNVQLGDWNALVNTIRKSDLIVVFGRSQCLSTDQSDFNTTCAPGMLVSIQPKYARLRRELNFSNRFDWDPFAS